MAEVSELRVATGLVAVEAAKQRLALLAAARRKDTIKSWVLDKKWPPPEGSLAARALSLSKDGDHFRQSRLVNQSFGWNESKLTSLGSFISKLKDPSLRVCEIKLYRHDSLQGIDWNLEAGTSRVHLLFSHLTDPSEEPITAFEWIALFEEPAVPKKKARGKSKTAI